MTEQLKNICARIESAIAELAAETKQTHGMPFTLSAILSCEDSQWSYGFCNGGKTKWERSIADAVRKSTDQEHLLAEERCLEEEARLIREMAFRRVIEGGKK